MDLIFNLLILAFFWRGGDMVMQMFAIPYFVFLFLHRTKDPCFVTCNHVLQEISVTLDPFQKMKTHVLLFDCQVFEKNLRTQFSHG